MKVITTVFERNQEFHIVKDEKGMYWGIKSDNIKNGRLINELNGLSGHCSKTLQECIDSVKRQIELDYLVGQGIDKMTAVFMIMN